MNGCDGRTIKREKEKQIRSVNQIRSNQAICSNKAICSRRENEKKKHTKKEKKRKTRKKGTTKEEFRQNPSRSLPAASGKFSCHPLCTVSIAAKYVILVLR